jgi:hypothetical protein
MGRCNINLLTTQSKLRAHAGLAPHQTRQKGQKLDYDNELKSVFWLIGRQIILAQDPYYAEYYYDRKNYYTNRALENGIKIIPTPPYQWVCKNCGSKFAKKRDIQNCCDTPEIEKITKNEPDGILFLGHLDKMAKRKMMIRFSDHLWECWREAEGLPCRPAYVYEYLGHQEQIHYYDVLDRRDNKM